MATFRHVPTLIKSCCLSGIVYLLSDFGGPVTYAHSRIGIEHYCCAAGNNAQPPDHLLHEAHQPDVLAVASIGKLNVDVVSASAVPEAAMRPADVVDFILYVGSLRVH